MADQVASFYKALVSAQSTAAKVVPAAYQSIDVLFFKGDEFQNSAGLALEQAVTELDALNIGDLISYTNQIKEAKITNLIMSNELITDPIQKQAHKQKVNEEIKKTIQMEQKLTENLMARLAKIKAEKANDKAIKQELAKAGIKIASSQEESDSERDSLENIINSTVQGPNDYVASA